MKSLVLVAMLMACSCISACVAQVADDVGQSEAQTGANSGTLDAGDQAPAWVGTDLISGASFNFPEGLAGQPAVLVFWASWCPYSRAFLPYLEALQWDYEETGIQVITLNAKQRGRGDPRRYALSLGFPLTVIAEADAIAAQYGVETVPGVFVVDGSGLVLYRRAPTDLPAGSGVAGQWDREVRQALESAL